MPSRFGNFGLFLLNNNKPTVNNNTHIQQHPTARAPFTLITARLRRVYLPTAARKLGLSWADILIIIARRQPSTTTQQRKPNHHLQIYIPTPNGEPCRTDSAHLQPNAAGHTPKLHTAAREHPSNTL
jgi:hypothetical protein